MRQIFNEIIQRYFRHDVGRSSAALTYYLVFAAFPLIIFFSTLLGALNLNFESVLKAVEQIMPAEVEQLIRSYFIYVQENQSRKLLVFSLVFSIWFPTRATSCLMRSMQRAFGVQPRTNTLRRQVAYQLRTLLFTVWMVGMLSASALLITVGHRALRWINNYVLLPAGWADMWEILRFILLGMLLFATLAVLYMLALGERQALRDMFVGIFLSLAAWMGVSVLFSYYVENLATYSQLYGSIATMVVTLLWLYMSASVIIMGAEINAVLLHIRKQRRREKEELAQEQETE